MYGLPDRLRPLSAAEEQVMLAVWACPITFYVCLIAAALCHNTL